MKPSIKPSVEVENLLPRCQGRNVDVGICCSPETPCMLGEGDCENDSDCNGNLVCGNNNCKQFGSIFHEKDDCCVETTLPKTGPRCQVRLFD